MMGAFLCISVKQHQNYPSFCIAHFPARWYNSSIIKFDMKRIFAMAQMVFAQQRTIWAIQRM